MCLSLEPNEAALLKRVLTAHLSDLRAEVYKTENYDWRQGLKQDEAIIKALITRLDEPGVTVR